MLTVNWLIMDTTAIIYRIGKKLGFLDWKKESSVFLPHLKDEKKITYIL